MALTATAVTGNPSPTGDGKSMDFNIVFSSTYATGGESFTISDLGSNFRRIKRVIVHGGVAAAADMATAIPIHYNYATSKFVFFEGSAAGTALSEKTNSEAYPTGCTCRVTVVGA